MLRLSAITLLALAAVGYAADPPKAAQTKAKAKTADAPVPPAPPLPPKTGPRETIQLFNGTDLAGWEGYTDHWSVKDGAIVGKNTANVPISTYLLTTRKFSDFHLKFEGKLVTSEMHSGVAFWGRVAPEKGKERSQYTYAGHLVMFPSGWGMYDLFGRNGKLGVDNKPALKVNKQHDWNAIEIFAQANRVRVVANGVLVVDWRDWTPEVIHEAPIGLQLHSNKDPQEVQFRGLTLTTFPDSSRVEGKKVGDAVP